MNKHAMHNVIVKSVNVESKPGFDIVLFFSGTPETVIHHAHDGMLFRLLRDGMRLDDLRRWHVKTSRCSSVRKSKRTSRKHERSVARTLHIIESYLNARSNVEKALCESIDAIF